MFCPPTFSKKHMRRACSFKITDHAMVQYLERGTKVNLDETRRALRKKRRKDGLIAKKLTDKDLLLYLEEERGFLGHKGVLEYRLKKSWCVHRDEKGCFRLLETGLVAVTNPADRAVITILTKEIAQKKVPLDLDQALDIYNASLSG